MPATSRRSSGYGYFYDDVPAEIVNLRVLGELVGGELGLEPLPVERGAAGWAGSRALERLAAELGDSIRCAPTRTRSCAAPRPACGRRDRNLRVLGELVTRGARARRFRWAGPASSGRHPARLGQELMPAGVRRAGEGGRAAGAVGLRWADALSPAGAARRSGRLVRGDRGERGGDDCAVLELAERDVPPRDDRGASSAGSAPGGGGHGGISRTAPAGADRGRPQGRLRDVGRPGRGGTTGTNRPWTAW